MNNISKDFRGSKSVIWERIFSLTPEASWVFVMQIGTGIAGLVGVKVLTNVLGPSEFGRLALANTVVMLVSTNFLFGPLGQGLMRFWSICQDRGELGTFYVVSNRYARYVIGISTAIAVAVVAIVVSIKRMDWAVLLTISMATGIVSGTLGLRLSVFTAARRRQRVALLSISNAIFSPIVAASLVLLVGPDASSAMLGYLIVVSGVVFVAGHFYRGIVSGTEFSSLTTEENISDIRKKILSFSWPFLGWGIFGWIHMSCDRWSLQTFYGAEVVGAFAVVSQLSIYPLAFGSGFLSTLFMPIAFQKAGDLTKNRSVVSANRILTGMTGAYILGTMLLIGCFVLYHQQLILLISNARFVTYSYLLPGLTTAWGLFFFGQVLTQYGLLANKPQLYIMPKIIASLVAGVTTFYLSFRMGAIGVVWGLAIAGLVYAIWCIVIAFKVVGANKVSIR